MQLRVQTSGVSAVRCYSSHRQAGSSQPSAALANAGGSGGRAPALLRLWPQSLSHAPATTTAASSLRMSTTVSPSSSFSSASSSSSSSASRLLRQQPPPRHFSSVIQQQVTGVHREQANTARPSELSARWF